MSFEAPSCNFESEIFEFADRDNAPSSSHIVTKVNVGNPYLLKKNNN